MCANTFGSVKELEEVGKDLPARAGDAEANREKNRYPYILPCECSTYHPRTDMRVLQCVRL